MSNTRQTDYGKIEITSEALAAIAGAAAVRCFGIVGMVTEDCARSLEILGGCHSRGVEVKQDGSDVIIDLYVCYGLWGEHSQVAQNVMETVRYEIEKMTELRPVEINVNVTGIRVFK